MAEFDVPFSPPTFDVYRLAQESAQDGETVIGVKLTDECLTALTAAHKRKTRLKLVVDEQNGGTVTIGDASFRFSTQSLPTPFADAVSCQPGVGFKAKASVGLKYTIQATQNSFEETRVKAQKLMEEEKSRGTKDVNKSRNGKKTEVGRGLSGSHASAALAHARASSLGVNKQMATTVLGGGNLSRNASPSLSSSASAAAAQARITVPYRADLMKKTLRERVVHIAITARYKSFDEVIARLRKDGLPNEQDSRKAIEDILREVSESSDSGRVCLKPCYFSEVNLKWKWLSTEEMNYIRKLQNPVNPSSTSFAPSRKSGVDRVMAPSATLNSSTITTPTISSVSTDRMREKDASRSSGSCSASTTSSPDAVPERTPPKGVSTGGTMGGGGAKKRPASPPMTDQSKEGEEDELYYTTTSSSKRKAHAPSSTTALTALSVPSKTTASPQTALALSSSRPVRQESASPPEDPTMGKEEMRGKASKMTSVSPRPPSSVPPSASSSQPPQPSSRVPSRAPSRVPSRAPSTSPRTDWSTVYGVISTGTEADNYHATFAASYAEYAETHAKMSKVAEEFNAMEKELMGYGAGSKEAEQVEAKIQSRYSFYEKDIDYIKLRNRHDDLRSKLSTIRSRLNSWETRRS